MGIRTWMVGRHMQVSVHDNGRSMPQAVQVRVFQHFFTTKPADEYTGLFLAHAIVTKGHGSTLEVKSHQARIPSLLH
ncbi:MAG: ATP-binding protein [Janthinobacterium lividum]